MFVASTSVTIFDHLRVPYEIGVGRAEAGGIPVTTVGIARGSARPSLFWPDVGRTGNVRRGVFRLGEIVIPGSIAQESALRRIAESIGGPWATEDPILDDSGHSVAWTRRNEDGDILLPFDPNDVIAMHWSEGYRHLGPAAISNARSLAVGAYYRVRPAVPRGMQIALRRRLAKRQGRTRFPRWPFEDNLHDFFDWLLEMLTEAAGEPVPSIAPWPSGYRWAAVLTHDIDTRQGFDDIPLLREPERARGLRSSWNVVPQRYPIDEDTLVGLRAEGCEIGVHGLRHDGRDLGSERDLRSRIPAMQAAARRWGATGFRSPATQRRWAWMPELGFAYDSSYPDTDPYEPTPGGCCSYLPFFNRDMVELPITMPQDHTLFAILEQRDASVWLEKLDHLRRRGGMALMLTHPDYARDPRIRGGYEAVLDAIVDDPTVWRPLPREVERWWRRRHGSTIEARGDGWSIHGPAAQEGEIRYTAVGAKVDSPT